MRTSSLVTLALAASAEAAYQGFNYGSTNTDGSAKTYDDFTKLFTTAQNLVGTSGFSSARLYTMIQGGTASTVISALGAAQDTKTSLLLGIWGSGGDAGFANELSALKTAISQYPGLKSQIVGLSVGSEDLYRVSPIGIENKSGVGAGPDVITNYIKQVRAVLSGSAWSGIPVGHVDTWTAWVNGSNSAVVTNSDFLGVDAYPYFQNTMSNDISSAQSLFNQALSNTEGASQGKPVWITETGWPVAGPVSNLATANTANAKTYWDQVGCPNFGKTNIWWYTLEDSIGGTPSPTFGVTGASLSTTPLYDLSCSNVNNSTSSSSTSSSASGSATASATVSATATGTNTAVPTGGALVPSGAGAMPFSNGTMTASSGSASATGSSGSGSSGSGSGSSGSGSGSSSGSSGSGSGSSSSSSGSSSSGSGSGSGSSTGSSGTSPTPFPGAASSTAKSSVFGILGALAAAIMLL